MPKLTVHLDGSGNWGHAYVSITSFSGIENLGDGTVRGNDPIPNPNYDPTLPKTGPYADDPDRGRDPNSYEYYPGDKQLYETVHYSDLPRHKNTPRYDKSYDITEQQYQNVKNYVEQVKNNPQYSGGVSNCTDFVQGAWQTAGKADSFADDIPSNLLTEMGCAGLWSWFWQKGIAGEMTDMVAIGAGIGIAGYGSVVGAVALGVGIGLAFAQYFTPIALDLNGSGAIDILSANYSLNNAFFDLIWIMMDAVRKHHGCAPPALLNRTCYSTSNQ
jgi:hypothetical protein